MGKFTDTEKEALRKALQDNLDRKKRSKENLLYKSLPKDQKALYNIQNLQDDLNYKNSTNALIDSNTVYNATKDPRYKSSVLKTNEKNAEIDEKNAEIEKRGRFYTLHNGERKYFQTREERDEFLNYLNSPQKKDPGKKTTLVKKQLELLATLEDMYHPDDPDEDQAFQKKIKANIDSLKVDIFGELPPAKKEDVKIKVEKPSFFERFMSYSEDHRNKRNKKKLFHKDLIKEIKKYNIPLPENTSPEAFARSLFDEFMPDGELTKDGITKIKEELDNLKPDPLSLKTYGN